MKSVAQTKTLNKRLVAGETLASEVLKELAAFTNHYEEPSSGVEILLVLFHMFCQLSDACCQYSYLNFGRPCVRTVCFVLLDYLLAFTVLGLAEGIRQIPYHDFISVCTDDVHAGDLLTLGHVNKVVRYGIEHGMDPVDVIRMANQGKVWH